jgi:hypothetical protein
VASETIAFEKHTKEYMETRNDEIYTLSLSNIQQLKDQIIKQGRLLKVTG